ncbi:MAG TPA: 23S rRNA (pseudouridine(1915)-N(3))-methyltransferase RlmH, partial [Gemmatimonadaceae bacterium]|nr:23S rRNA (pseudouridine(1915)-N(3))-methyltransferase RlmH [Gemmatimonadaceae bacterium]
KPRDAALHAAISEYETRAARYWPLAVHEVREESGRATPPDLVREREGERLLGRIPPGCRIIACDPAGDALSSERFSRFLVDAREAARDLAFVIGGAHGLSTGLLARAERKLLLAPWTLPHELARLVLAEQLYRAGTIARGEPYHK